MAPSLGSPDRRTSSLSSQITQRLRRDGPLGFDQAVVIDHANQDYVSGWAMHPDGVERIDIFVDGRRVGSAIYGSHRADVAQRLPEFPEAAFSGFAYLFREADLRRTAYRTVSVHVVCHSTAGGSCSSFPVELPTALLPSRYLPEVSSATVRPPLDEGYASPFPADIGEVLRLLRGEDASEDRLWTMRRVDESIDDLILASEIASRDTAGLFWYFSYLREMWTRLEFNARNFPAMNRTVSEDRKDTHSVATSPIELFVMCHHLATLKSYGVDGNVCEFGCFKGFSTAALSEACFRLGMTMDVFDSFEGLPASTSTLYHEGEFAGTLDEVQANVREFGNLRSVRFHKGFFSETVDLYDRNRIALLWLDVDLEVSARDAMRLFPRLDARSCVFSDECAPEDFVVGEIVEEVNPDRVVEPICDAFRGDGRVVKGQFVAGHTGCFFDPNQSIPVLMAEPLLRLKDALL